MPLLFTKISQRHCKKILIVKGKVYCKTIKKITLVIQMETRNDIFEYRKLKIIIINYD